MNKKILGALALTLSLTFSLSGCSCSSLEPITFNNAFNGGNGDQSYDPQVGYTETLTYSVKKDNKDLFYVDNSYIPSGFEFGYDGTYTTILSVVSTIPNEISENNEVYDILVNDNSYFYKLETKLSVEANYKFNEQEETKQDAITTTTYFATMRNSFAPIYSIKTANYNILALGNESFALATSSYIYKIVYSTDTYKVEKTFNEGTELEKHEEKTFNYTYKTAIDNNELLFALRNVEIETDKTIDFPVVEASYGEAKSLLIKNQTTTSDNLTINYNGTPYTQNIPLVNYSFCLNDPNASGMNQMVFIQKKTEGASNIPYKSLLVKYAHPLYEYYGIKCLGAIVYTLTDISISNPN